MNIAVCVNHVPDTASKIKLDSSNTSIDYTGVSWILNPFDEFAIEEALRFKDNSSGTVVYILSAGKDEAKETIRRALSMGADEGILIKNDLALDSLSISELLAMQIKELNCEVVFCGKQSVDYDNTSIGLMIAEIIDYNAISDCVTLSIEGSTVKAEREIEGGREIIETSLPLVVTAQKGLNVPRYASLKGIIAAKKKNIKEVTLTSSTSTVKYNSLSIPNAKNPGRVLGSDSGAVRELVRLLREEAKVL